MSGQKGKRDFIFKNKWIFMFNDTGLDAQRFDQKLNIIIIITQFEFFLSLYPLLILTCTPFNLIYVGLGKDAFFLPNSESIDILQFKFLTFNSPHL